MINKWWQSIKLHDSSTKTITNYSKWLELNKRDKIEWILTKIGKNPAQMSADRIPAYVINGGK